MFADFCVCSHASSPTTVFSPMSFPVDRVGNRALCLFGYLKRSIYRCLKNGVCDRSNCLHIWLNDILISVSHRSPIVRMSLLLQDSRPVSAVPGQIFMTPCCYRRRQLSHNTFSSVFFPWIPPDVDGLCVVNQSPTEVSNKQTTDHIRDHQYVTIWSPTT